MSYRREVWHDDLNKYRVVTGRTRREVDQKAYALLAKWEEMWERKRQRQLKQELHAIKAANKQMKKDRASESTDEAQTDLDALDRILAEGLASCDPVAFSELKDTQPFAEPEPEPPEVPSPPVEPDEGSERFRPDLTLMDWLVPSWRRRKKETAAATFQRAVSEWREASAEHQEAREAAEAEHAEACAEWRRRKATFYEEQEEHNAAVDRNVVAFGRGAPGPVEDYFELVLSRSEYPDCFPQDFELEYHPNTKSLVVDYVLPTPEDLPTLKEVKYVQSQDEFREKHLSGAQLNRLYDSVVYQTALRTLHELFRADEVSVPETVTFNGWVHAVDKGTGQDFTACVMSLQSTKGEFLALDLSRVEPKACFKSLKGVAATKLHALTPVAPILRMTREDARFVPSRDVMDAVDEGDNLAAMPWDDFEHLIRELFAAEFSTEGGEVRVTQASRDGGVDAIAMDPDPIRGGKIAIQAKRYTKTVGVAAVRDLYGTVMNEGAMKGILVTTSDYGPEAYSFAKDKPITLLNGANLLHLLAKHGQTARIDLAEARKELGLN